MDYFASNDGSDINGTGAADKPWRTLKYAIQQLSSRGGDILWLDDGTYSAGDILTRRFDSMTWVRSANPMKAIIENFDLSKDMGHIGFRELTFRGCEAFYRSDIFQQIVLRSIKRQSDLSVALAKGLISFGHPN